MRISDGSSDVCSSDLMTGDQADHQCESADDDEPEAAERGGVRGHVLAGARRAVRGGGALFHRPWTPLRRAGFGLSTDACSTIRAHEHSRHRFRPREPAARSEEHTSELQSLMRISYAVFCLKKKNKNITNVTHDFIHGK